MKRLIYLFSLFLLLSQSAFAAANHYVRAGATGNNDGTDWTNAWTALPATLTRGDTYYIASGTYTGPYVFNTANSGSTYIYIKKATVAAHGTNTGWSDSFATGQAVWTSTYQCWEFRTSYWDIDGVVGSGKTGHGFRLNSSNTTNRAFYNGSGYTVSNIIVRRTEMNSGGWGNSSQAEVVELGESASSYFTFSYCYFHGGGQTWITTLSSNVTVEYSYFFEAGSNNGSYHSAGIVVSAANFTLRYSVLENMMGTANTTYIEPQANSYNIYIYGNVFWSSSASEGTTQGIFAVTASDTCSNCWVTNNTAYSLNKISGGATTGLWGGNVGGSSIYVYNNVWKDCTDPYIYDPGTNVTDANNSLDGSGVNFSNAAAGVFTLTSATAAGTTLGSPLQYDPTGATRGSDGNWDIGAYEYSGGGPPPDTTPPTISNKAPSGTITCTSEPMTITESLSTSEAATARYSATNQLYSEMSSTFSTTGGFSHSREVSRACGASYTTYIAAADASNNASATEAITYTIGAAGGTFIAGTRIGEQQTCTLKGVSTNYYIEQANPNMSFISTQTVWFGSGASNLPTASVLLYFNLSSIPSSATVTAAKLYVYKTADGGGDSSLYVSVHRVSGDTWHTSGGTTTWNVSATGEAWTAGGGYSDIEAAESEVAFGAAAGWKEFEVVTMTSGWIAGTFANKGLLLGTDQGTNHATAGTWKEITSIRYSDDVFRPFLVVAYTVPSPENKTVNFTTGSKSIGLSGGSRTLTW